MCYFLLGDDFTLGKNLHGVDTSSILLPDLENSTESTSSDEFEEFEIGWLEMRFVLVVSAVLSERKTRLTRMAV
jgi:hypothetical protein